MSGDSGAADQGGTGGANNGGTGGSGADSNKSGVGNENSKDAFQPVTYKSQEELDAAWDQFDVFIFDSFLPKKECRSGKGKRQKSKDIV